MTYMRAVPKRPHATREVYQRLRSLDQIVKALITPHLPTERPGKRPHVASLMRASLLEAI